MMGASKVEVIQVGDRQLFLYGFGCCWMLGCQLFCGFMYVIYPRRLWQFPAKKTSTTLLYIASSIIYYWQTASFPCRKNGHKTNTRTFLCLLDSENGSFGQKVSRCVLGIFSLHFNRRTHLFKLKKTVFMLQFQRKRRVVARVQCRSIKNECPEPTCDEPVLLPNRCCKSCPGDSFSKYNF